MSDGIFGGLKRHDTQWRKMSVISGLAFRSSQVTSTNPIDGFYRTITSVGSKVGQDEHAWTYTHIYHLTNQIIQKRIVSVCAKQSSLLLRNIHKNLALTLSMQNPSLRTASDKQSASVAKTDAFCTVTGDTSLLTNLSQSCCHSREQLDEIWHKLKTVVHEPWLPYAGNLQTFQQSKGMNKFSESVGIPRAPDSFIVNKVLKSWTAALGAALSEGSSSMSIG